jgi:histidinol-phosphatase
MSIHLKSRLDFAVEATKSSSKITLQYFGQADLDKHTKDDGSPVTIADRACEQDLRDRIGKRFPEDSILGEEFPSKKGTSEYEWVIDPIDGTISFVHGVPLFGTMLACLHNGVPILGVIHMPVLDETVYAGDGLGCWHIDRHKDVHEAQVSTTQKLGSALVNTTSLSYFSTPPLRQLYVTIDERAKHTRGWSDCYAWILLATGRVDAVIEPVLSLWDYAAAIPIITEAGGQWSDFQGDLCLGRGEIIASNPSLHPQILKLIDPQPP